MTLPKHLRARWRYVAVALAAPEPLDRAAFADAVDRSARALLGDPGAADARLDLVDFECSRDDRRGADAHGHAVLRVRRSEVEPARAALACVHEVEGRPLGLRVRGVSGTLRACRRRYAPETEGGGGDGDGDDGDDEA